jgi:dsDNA-specific endonuclease/ATPase MutS2
LRDAVRGHLSEHPQVEAQRPGGAHEGGDGVTCVTLGG